MTPLRLRRELGLRDLVLFNIAAVAGIRWLAAAAQMGADSIALWLLAAVLFFVPSALVISTLSARFPQEGGIYVWTKHAFGDWHGFLCGWCYWLSNLAFFPNLVISGVGMAGYALSATENKSAVLLISLVILWVALLTNLFGLRIGKWTQGIGATATYSAGLLLIVLGAWGWILRGPVTPIEIAPEWNWGKMNFWSQLAYAFAGLELSAVMAGEIREPQRTIPLAAWIAGLSIAIFYILGTLAILVFLPPAKISVLTGLIQAGRAASARLSVAWLPTILTVLVLLGVGGQLGAWMGGVARVPFAIGLDRYLPPAFAKLHPKWQTPYVALLVQGLASTIFVIGFQIGENLRMAYQLLVDLEVITYLLPFLYMFAVGWRYGRRWSAASGVVVTGVAIAFSLIPPAGTASRWLFELKLIGGTALLIITGRACFRRRIFEPKGGQPYPDLERLN